MSNKTLANICAKHGFPEAVVDAMKNIPTVEVNEVTGGSEFSDLNIIKRQPIQGYTGSILASLVSGATYAQSGNTVTVTAAAHGLPTTKSGYRIFWPGSAAVVDGWYSGFAYVDVNTFTFNNPTSQTVAGGTAMTGSLPYLSETSFASTTIKGETLNPNNSMLSVKFLRSGDSTGGTKKLRVAVNGQTVAESLLNSSGLMAGQLSLFSVYGSLTGAASTGADGSPNSAGNQYFRTISLGSDIGFSANGVLANASQWMSLDAISLEITK